MSGWRRISRDQSRTESIVDSIVNLFNLMIEVHPMVFLWENQITNMDLLIINYWTTCLNPRRYSDIRLVFDSPVVFAIQKLMEDSCKY